MAGGSGAGAGRSTAIVLFTDLVRSTLLRSSLGEDATEDLRRKHDRLVTDAIEANRGRVVKNLGDGFMATFSGAGDAVAAAVEIQQALDRHNRSGGGTPLLEVRIGISAGDVVFESGDSFGTPVIEAARLCAAAEGGQILATEVVRLLAGTGGGHKMTPVGALELRGLPEPVHACGVAWESLPAAAIPLPSVLTGVGRIFVGRNEELGRLTQLWKEASAGERRLALLAGEPGIGKTRLAVELARAAHAEGSLVLAGRCDEDLGVPYQPFVEALRHYVGHAPRPRLGRYGGELTRLVPEVADTGRDLAPPMRSDPETERFRLFEAVAIWLAELSTETPVLLVLDDVHWAAKPTLLLLRHIVRSPEPLRLLVIITYRDSEVGRGHPLSGLLGDLRRVEGVERFPLSGLDQAAVAAFIESAAGHALSEEDEAFPRAVWAETEGNPFFVTEVLRHLTETGGVEYRNGRWITTAAVEDLAIPEGVREVVGRRLSRLSEDANRALAVAAVVGLEFEPEVVGRAGYLGEDVFLTALEEAVTARLLTEVSAPAPRYRFGHALVRATLYDELTGARRVVLHRRVAEAIQAIHADDLDDYLPALAHHWARAAAPAAETAVAVDYAARAGDRALDQLAHDEAAAYYRQALELATVSPDAVDEGRRLELLISLGEAQRRAGEGEYRRTLLDAAELAKRRGNADALARAALANSRAAFFGAVGKLDTERVAVLEAALDGVGPEESPRRARLLANLGVELVSSGDRTRRVALSNEALALARRLGDLRTHAEVLLARFYTIHAPDTLSERLAMTADLQAMAERLGDPILDFLSAWLRLRCVVETGDAEEADRCLGIMERLADELGQPTLRWTLSWNRVARVLSAGRLADADRLSRESLELGLAAGQADARVFFAIQQFHILFDTDGLGELEGTLAAAAARAPTYLPLQLMLAILYHELDRVEEARAIFDPLATTGFAGVPHDYAWIWAMGLCAHLSAHLPDPDSAQLVHDLLLPYHEQIVVTASIFAGAVAHYLGMLATTLARFAEAETHFASAETTHKDIGAPTWLARTRLERALMLLSRRQPGDVARARELLDKALTTAQELGLANLERGAIALLTRA